MPTKTDTTPNIKSYMTTQDKNTGKTKPLEHKGSVSKSQNINTNINMVKEASPNESKQKNKASKNAKENKLPTDTSLTLTSTPTLTSVKRDSSERSPLDGQPQKRQCETTAPINSIENIQQASATEQPQIEEQAEGIINPPVNSLKEKEEEQKKNLPTQSNEPDQKSLMQTILQELKSIKETIHILGEKVDISCEKLAVNTSENTELKKVIATQNNQITTLLSDNTILKGKDKTLEKDLKEMEDEMLRLKVDIMGIPESVYKTYEHLRGKITEIMMTVSEGNTEQARWEVSSNIPITDCRRIGTYRRNSKRPVRVTFLFIKHKNCLLSRKSNLMPGIFVDEAFTETTRRNRALLRPILKLAKTQEEYKGQCKLENDQLIIKGKHYSLETLKLLPDNLAPYKTAQKSSSTCLVFQGLHSPSATSIQVFSHIMDIHTTQQSNTSNTQKPVTLKTIKQQRRLDIAQTHMKQSF